jgi:hypothetical protein
MLKIRGPVIPVAGPSAKELTFSMPAQVANFNLSKSIAKPLGTFNLAVLYEGKPAMNFINENTDDFKLTMPSVPVMTNRVAMSQLVEDFQIPDAPDLVYDKGIRPGKRPLQ